MRVYYLPACCVRLTNMRFVDAAAALAAKSGRRKVFWRICVRSDGCYHPYLLFDCVWTGMGGFHEFDIHILQAMLSCLLWPSLSLKPSLLSCELDV